MHRRTMILSTLAATITPAFPALAAPDPTIVGVRVHNELIPTGGETALKQDGDSFEIALPYDVRHTIEIRYRDGRVEHRTGEVALRKAVAEIHAQMVGRLDRQEFLSDLRRMEPQFRGQA